MRHLLRYVGGLVGVGLCYFVVGDLLSAFQLTPRLPLSPGDWLPTPNLDWLFAFRSGGKEEEGVGPIASPGFWQKLRQSPFDDPLMPFPSLTSARLGLRPEQRETRSGSSPQSTSVGRSPQLHFLIASGMLLLSPLYAALTPPGSVGRSLLKAWLSLNCHVLTVAKSRAEYDSGERSRMSVLAIEAVGQWAVLTCSLIPMPRAIRTAVVYAQWIYCLHIIGDGPKALKEIMSRESAQGQRVAHSTNRSSRPQTGLEAFLDDVLDGLGGEVEYVQVAVGLLKEALSSALPLVGQRRRLTGQREGGESALLQLPQVVALYKVSRRSRQLGRERSQAMLQSLLDQPPLRRALQQQMSGEALEVDENSMMVKGMEGLATLEAYHHGAVVEPLSGRVVRAFPGGVDVYATFPIRCAASGRTAILCVEGTTRQTASEGEDAMALQVAAMKEELAADEAGTRAQNGFVIFHQLSRLQRELEKVKGELERQVWQAEQRRPYNQRALVKLTQQIADLQQQKTQELSKRGGSRSPSSSDLSRFFVLDPWPRDSRHFAGRVAAGVGSEEDHPGGKDAEAMAKVAAEAAWEWRRFVVLGGARDSGELIVRRVELVECRPSDYPAVREQPIPMFMPVLPRVPALQQHHPDHPCTLLYAAADARLPPSYPRPIVSENLRVTVPLSPITPEDTKRALRTLQGLV